MASSLAFFINSYNLSSSVNGNGSPSLSSPSSSAALDVSSLPSLGVAEDSPYMSSPSYSYSSFASLVAISIS